MSHSMARAGKLATLICVLWAALACSPAETGVSSQPGPGWRDAAPLPEPRWFHASGVDSDGRLYAFGGNVLLGGLQQEGLGERGLVYLDPNAESWARAPRPRPFARTSRTFAISDDVETTPIERESTFPPARELPNGGSDGRR